MKNFLMDNDTAININYVECYKVVGNKIKFYFRSGKEVEVDYDSTEAAQNKFDDLKKDMNYNLDAYYL